MVERAVGVALQKLEDVVERIPRLESQTNGGAIDRTQPSKTFGDFLTYHRGRRVLIDVTMTSNLLKMRDLKQAEIEKRKEYANNQCGSSEETFVVMAVDCMGGWGDEMIKYFKEANEQYKEITGVKRNTQFRYAREWISLAICKANGIYMRRIREGIPNDSMKENSNVENEDDMIEGSSTVNGADVMTTSNQPEVNNTSGSLFDLLF